MIKMLGHYRCLNFGCDSEMVQVSLVMCTNTNLVHPTWLTCSIPGICASTVSMRHVVLDLVLLDVHFGSFSLQWPMIKMLGHYRCLNFRCDPEDGASEPCDMHKYKSCASYLDHLHHPCDVCV